MINGDATMCPGGTDFSLCAYLCLPNPEGDAHG